MCYNFDVKLSFLSLILYVYIYYVFFLFFFFFKAGPNHGYRSNSAQPPTLYHTINCWKVNKLQITQSACASVSPAVIGVSDKAVWIKLQHMHDMGSHNRPATWVHTAGLLLGLTQWACCFASHIRPVAWAYRACCVP